MSAILTELKQRSADSESLTSETVCNLYDENSDVLNPRLVFVVPALPRLSRRATAPTPGLS